MRARPPSEIVGLDIGGTKCAGSLWLRCRDLLGPEMRRVLRAEALADSRRACRIVPAKLGERIGNYGAVCVALHGLRLLEPKS